jgi:hypothetical protein
MFIWKLDGEGKFCWVKKIGGFDNDISQAIVSDNAGNTYITGNFKGSVNFDPGFSDFLVNLGDNEELFIYKLDKDGKFQWVKAFGENGNNHGRTITIDAAGDIHTVANLPDKAIIEKFSPSGNNDFSLTIEGKLNYSAIAADKSGALYRGGEFEGKVDFNPWAGDYFLNCNDESDGFIGKFKGSTFEEKTDVVSIITVSPNPADNFLNIFSSNNDIGWVRIFDVQGKLVIQKNFQTQVAQIDISNLASAPYLVNMEGDKSLLVIKQ